MKNSWQATDSWCGSATLFPGGRFAASKVYSYKLACSFETRQAPQAIREFSISPSEPRGHKAREENLVPAVWVVAAARTASTTNFQSVAVAPVCTERLHRRVISHMMNGFNLQTRTAKVVKDLLRFHSEPCSHMQALTPK